MSYEFSLPDVGEGVAEGELVAWLVEPGERVSEDQPLAEVETDKAVIDIPSPVEGTVAEQLYEEGEIVPVGETFIVINIDGAGNTAQPAESEVSETPREDVQDTHVFTPPSVRRLARELGVDIETVDGSGPSGRITEHDVRATAANSSELTIDEGGSISKGNVSTTESVMDGETVPDRDRTLARPSTRKLAAELKIDIDAVPADDKYEGEPFVTADAVRELADRVESTEETVPRPTADTEATERIPYRGIRRTIGEQMERSKYTIPHATYISEADVTELVRIRNQLNEDGEVRLTFMPFIIKACVAALQEYPHLNSELDEEAEEIVLQRDYHIGVATETDHGLLVPVLDHADAKSIPELASNLESLVEAGRDGDLAPSDLRGSTFTITNFGAIGGQYGTPIINYPEVAILGCGAIVDRPRIVERSIDTDDSNDRELFADAKIVPRKVMGLSLSIDHRVIDGATAAKFTGRVREYLEDPKLLLLE